VVPHKSNIVQCQFPAHPPVHKEEKNGKKGWTKISWYLQVYM
jgi:hypothetical protein